MPCPLDVHFINATRECANRVGPNLRNHSSSEISFFYQWKKGINSIPILIVGMFDDDMLKNLQKTYGIFEWCSGQKIIGRSQPFVVLI